MKKHGTAIIISIFLSFLFITFGFAFYSNDLSINNLYANIRPIADARVTGVSLNGTTLNASSNNLDYNINSIYSDIVLPNNSSVTYTVEFTNFTNYRTFLIGIDNLPNNLKYEIDYGKDNKYSLGDLLFDSFLDTKTITITISYKSNGYQENHENYHINLTFNFRNQYIVNYYYQGLPDGYQEVEYISSNKNDYILTDILPAKDIGVYIKFSVNNLEDNQVYFGSGNNTNSFLVGSYNDKVYFKSNYLPDKNIIQGTSIEENNILAIKFNYLNDKKIYINDVNYLNNINLLSSLNIPITIFGYNNNNNNVTNLSTIKLYEFKVSRNNKIIANYIPCYRLSDNKVGLYDIINNVFYSNDDNFIKGEIVYNYHYIYSQEFVYGSTGYLIENTYTKEGYTFLGWDTKPFGNGTLYQNNAVMNNNGFLENDEINLYAKWTPNFTVTGNPVNWTNQDVTLVIVPGNTYNNFQYSFDGGATWINNSSTTYQNNNQINIKIKDQFANVSNNQTINITKIDKIKPTISNVPLIVTLDESNLINSLITVVDNESGIDSNGLQVHRYVVSTSQTTDLITNTNYFEYPGLYAVNLDVSDVAGNTTSVNSSILVRWPTGGKYVVRKTELDGANIQGTGLSNSNSSSGLYKDNASTGGNTELPFASKYYFTGSVVDNYVSFAGSTFRILNVSTNDDIKVIGDLSDVKTAWGDRKIFDSNTYNTWSTKWWPRGQIYNNETGESRYKLFTATEKAHLALATFYAGRFNKSDAFDIQTTVYYEQNGGVNLGGSNNPAFEGYSAYPNVSDYLKASKAHNIVINIDDTQDDGLLGIGTTKRDVFNSNSWIDMSQDQWTMNSKNATSTDNDFWVLDGTLNGRIVSRTYYFNQQYRVVFYLTNSTILSGDGSSNSPYTVHENWQWFDDAQVLQ